MQRILIILLLVVLATALFSTVSAQGGVTAQAVGQANLRAAPGTDAAQTGQIVTGTYYPVVGRSELYPWLLLADPLTQQPIGWVFSELVAVQGNLNSVPFSTAIVDGTRLPVSTSTGAPVSSSVATSSPMPTATLSAAVIGVVQGEVNVRYGPGVEYARVGVARAGDTFEVTGYHTLFPWIQVKFSNAPGERAWIAQDLLEIQGDLFSTKAVTATDLGLPTLTPTPSVISASAGPNGTEVPLSPEFAALGNQLFNIMLNANFDPQTNRFGALFVLDLQTKEAFTFGNDVAFSGTSVNKVSILTTLYGVLSIPPDGQLATDIANTMICSENSATNRLLSAVGRGDEWAGAEEVSRFLRQLGLTNSFITSPYVTDPNKPLVPPRPIPIPITDVNQSKANPDLTNQLTVEEIGRLLEDVYQCGYEETGPLIEQFPGQYEPRECRQMLWVMSNNNVDALLKAGVPETTRVAHKHGWIEDTHSNAAVFFTPGGNYIIAIMMFQPTWLNYYESLPVAAEISRTVYNHFNPDTPMAAIREGFIPETATCNFANTPLITDLRQPVWDK